jgi:hypothetical protein
MIQTITITTPTSLYSIANTEPISLLIQLKEIFLKYSHQTDPVSLRLSGWIVSAFDATADEAVEKIRELIEKILISPLDQAFVQKPRLCDGLLIEKRVLETYNRLHPESRIAWEPHPYAQAMAIWVKEANRGIFSASSLISKECLHGASFLPALIRQAKLTQTIYLETQKLKHKLTQEKEKRRELRSFFDELRVSSEESIRQNNEALKQRLGRLSDAHHETVEEVKERLKLCEDDVQAMQSRVERAEEKAEQQQNQIQEILEDRLRRSQEAELTLKEILQRIVSLEERHQREQATLQQQIGMLGNELSEEQKKARQAIADARKQESQVEALRNTNAWQTGEIARLSKKAKGSDCICM